MPFAEATAWLRLDRVSVRFMTTRIGEKSIEKLLLPATTETVGSGDF